jgi:hypothetical protein
VYLASVAPAALRIGDHLLEDVHWETAEPPVEEAETSDWYMHLAWRRRTVTGRRMGAAGIADRDHPHRGRQEGGVR